MKKPFKNRIALVATASLFVFALTWNVVQGSETLQGSHITAAPTAPLLAHGPIPPPDPPCDPCGDVRSALSL